MAQLYHDWNKEFGHYGRLSLEKLQMYRFEIIREGAKKRAPGETRKARLYLWLHDKQMSWKLQGWMQRRMSKLECGYVRLRIAEREVAECIR